MYNEIVSLNFKEIPVNIQRHHCGKLKFLSALHYHDEIEILTVESGCILIECGNEKISIGAGESVFLGSRTVHKTFCKEPYLKYTLIQFNVFDYLETHKKELIRFINLFDNPVYVFKNDNPDTAGFYSLIQSIADEFDKKTEAYAIFIKAYMYNILALLLRNNVISNNFDITNKKLLETLLPAIDYIGKNYSEKITLSELCGIVNLSEEYFCRIFKKATNSTVTEYINFVRISRAEKLLSTTSKTISEISMDTGFSSLSYFNKVFKKYRFCSPSIYKKIKYGAE